MNEIKVIDPQMNIVIPLYDYVNRYFSMFIDVSMKKHMLHYRDRAPQLTYRLQLLNSLGIINNEDDYYKVTPEIVISVLRPSETDIYLPNEYNGPPVKTFEENMAQMAHSNNMRDFFSGINLEHLSEPKEDQREKKRNENTNKNKEKSTKKAKHKPRRRTKNVKR